MTNYRTIAVSRGFVVQREHHKDTWVGLEIKGGLFRKFYEADYHYDAELQLDNCVMSERRATRAVAQFTQFENDLKALKG